ncbi:phospholipase A [Fulvivirga sedimenti]|uniref:Phosphatidylcholine 1-acylhydrolase n=1 Tax=Fulvivirga sedimenti TaxID=2879465 RepID=A0A9X1L3A6_9BACT|nr:phospholipase A [Fulvivirga sedimenti]MCA6079096.1 phospholipase A [Fulvivirga sedimenti]
MNYVLSFLLLMTLAIESSGQDQPIFNDYKLFKSLSERWEIDTSDVLGNFRITPYQPIYVLLARFSSNPNRMPTSLNPEYSLEEEIPINATELKFQISLKTKIVRGFILPNLDIWAAYTQKSHWQLYNGELSRPFRETNYEPELILNYRMNLPILGFRARVAGIAFNHQSNGRSLPLSRSWNRIVFHMALEREYWQIYLKPWIRLNDEDDENPRITDYYGRMQAIVSRRYREHLFTLDATHSMRFGNNNRGSIRIDWAFPIEGFLRGRIEIFEGYGETLIDYNHRQFVIGAGLSLVEWR